MKKYLSPEIEFIEYDTEDCLAGSEVIERETEDIGGILDDLA